MGAFSRFDWATPLVPSFNLESLASQLGLLGEDSCRARKQGRCEGRDLCADCAWSEDPAEKDR